MNETEIEAKIKALAPNPCRGCTHFMRVNSDGYYNVTNRQGFCILGQLEGDWGGIQYSNVMMALDCWNDAINDEVPNSKSPTPL